MYSLANALWVAALCEEMTTGSPIVLVQDYHFALAPGMIRERLPRATTATFWHIPFPGPGVLAACPWERALLEGLLGSSVMGFQTPDDCRNFLDAAVCVLGAHVDGDEHVVSYRGHRTLVRAYPASIEWPSRVALESPPVNVCRTAVRSRFGMPSETQLIVGVDRLDYTKGLLQKFFALERLLIMRPEFRGKAVLLQVAEPSRSCLPAYSGYRAQVHRTADRINQRFATNNYQPIVLLDRSAEKAEVFELFRAADVCYVGSLHDGMNLVSKEFVSARDDENGVLILSKFAGAARELNDALCINPYSGEDCARTLADALTMPIEGQAARMRSMRAVVGRSSAYHWAENVLTDAIAVHADTRARSGSGHADDTAAVAFV
jgi:trehalose 6-phosphate synthase